MDQLSNWVDSQARLPGAEFQQQVSLNVPAPELLPQHPHSSREQGLPEPTRDKVARGCADWGS